MFNVRRQNEVSDVLVAFNFKHILYQAFHILLQVFLLLTLSK